MDTADWAFPTRILIGPGRVAELAAACVAAGITRPLVVTDTGLASSPMMATVEAVLAAGALPHVCHTGVRPDPTEDDVTAGVAAFRDGGCDGVVALGGGSALDVGKLIALMAEEYRPVWTFEDLAGATPARPIGRVAPVVAVPTTAGTGSEVGRASVLTDPTTRTKRIVFHPAMMPAAVICDPELTVSLPRFLTVGTGMDAFSHALEAYCSPRYHPAADGIATEAMRLVVEHLPVAADHPHDLHARHQMLAAALMGATAFQKGLGAMHAIAHPVGAHFGTHHGTTNAVLMPYVLVANRPAIEERIMRLTSALGIAGGFDGFMHLVHSLRSTLGVPDTLVELGVPASAVDVIRAAAPLDPSAATNPVPVTADYVETVFTAACLGNPDTTPAPAATVAP